MNESRRQSVLLFTLLVLGVFTFIIWTQPIRQDSSILSVYFLDVGQGDSIFIEAPNGVQMLIDGGRNGSVVGELSRYMDFNDRSIDVVLATHPDSDHIGGLPTIFDRYDVAYYIDPGKEGDTNTYRELITREEAEGSQALRGVRGTSIVLDPKHGVYFQILAPDPSFTFRDTNDFSIVGKLVYGDVSFLLTGDASKAVENILAYTDGDYLHSTILKAGHHGSKTSSSLLFLEKVQPEISIISAGAGNSYGHPHQITLQNLAAVYSEIQETSKEGTIGFSTDGQTLWEKE